MYLCNIVAAVFIHLFDMPHATKIPLINPYNLFAVLSSCFQKGRYVGTYSCRLIYKCIHTYINL